MAQSSRPKTISTQTSQALSRVDNRTLQPALDGGAHRHTNGRGRPPLSVGRNTVTAHGLALNTCAHRQRAAAVILTEIARRKDAPAPAQQTIASCWIMILRMRRVQRALAKKAHDGSAPRQAHRSLRGNTQASLPVSGRATRRSENPASLRSFSSMTRYWT